MAQSGAAIEKELEARALRARFDAIMNLPRQQFTPVQRPWAAATPSLDDRAVMAAFRDATLRHIGVLDLKGRKLAKSAADAAAARWLAEAQAENVKRRAQAQEKLDSDWAALMRNEGATVEAAVTTALRGSEPRVAFVSSAGAEVSLAVAAPTIAVIPERSVGTTPTGRLSLKRLSKTDANGWYFRFLAGCVLMAAKRAFSGAPAVEVAHVLAVVDGTALMGATLRRDRLEQVKGRADAAEVLLGAVADQVAVRTVGATKAMAPIDVGDRELAAAIAALKRPMQPSTSRWVGPDYVLAPTANAIALATRAAVPEVGESAPVAAVGALGAPVEGSKSGHKARRTGLVASAVAVLVLVGGWLGFSSFQPDDIFTVAEVEGPGTIRVLDNDGVEQLIELEHVLIPTTGDCLSGPAVAALEELLPIGTEVEVTDGEVIAEGVLVNAELAREGFAVADPAGMTSDTEYQAVEAAQQEAASNEAGLYSTSTACTLPAQTEAFIAATATLSSEAEALIVLAVLDQAQIDSVNKRVTTATISRDKVISTLKGDRNTFPLVAFTNAELDAISSQVFEADEELTSVVERVNERIETENERIRQEAEAAAAAQRAAEEAAAAAAAAEEERRAAERAASSSSSSGSSSSSSGSSSSSSGSSSGSSVYYPNCAAVRAAGASPLLAGMPGYSFSLDRDKDGVACE